MEKEPHILFERRGGLGLITLNRPKALNALTHGMCLGMARTLAQWAGDPAVRTVAIRGAGSRGFCAGGDIRFLYESSLAATDAAARFLADEYKLNGMIGAFPKPYVALLNGVVMGGGAGVSVHGRYRVADGSLVFAMPESAIGFVTDVGATHFLSHCPGESGIYLGLTGARIGLADAVWLGLVTHRAEAADQDAVLARLEQEDPARVLADMTASSAGSPLAARRGQIDRMFAAPTVEAILERLDRDGGDFAAQTAAAMRSRSPTALKFILRALREAKGRSLPDCLKMEYRIAARAVMAHDFREGVRAVLLDRDNRPQWEPASLAAVGEADISRYFAPLGGRELNV